jgi:sulfite reductase (NADPH) flavoprotein alpha-component
MYKPNVKKLFKQTHKILGLVFCILIAFVGITGALLSYASELSRMEISYLERNKSGDVLSTEQILQRFVEQKPKAKINGILYERDNKPLGIRTRYNLNDVDPNDELIFEAGDGSSVAFYSLSPYTAEILPTLSGKIFRVITTLHASLAANEIGRNVVAITTMVIMVISIIGLYIYFPMLKQNFSKSMKIDFKSKGYGFWYKLHSVIGVYTFVFVFIMCFSGLTFSYDWFRTLFHKAIGYEHNYEPQEAKQQEPKPFDMQEVISALEIAKTKAKENDAILVYNIPNMTNEPYIVFYKNKDYATYCGGHSLSIDMQTNETIHEDEGDKSLKEQITCMGAIHAGHFFGEIGKALWCVSSLAMGLFGVSGVMMWWKRNRKKQSL